MSDKLVSICLPTYNYAHYLPQAISSCLSQSYEPLEVVVVDDASADNTREVVESFDDPRITFVVNEQRLGLARNWNRALSLTRGEVVKFLFADDCLADGSVEAIAAAFEDPGVDLVFSSAKVIDGRGDYTYTHQPYPDSRRLPGPAEAKRCLMEGNYIGGPTSVAIRAGAFGRVGDFDESLRFYVDQEMWIRVLLQGDGYFLSEPLVAVRQHEGSETRRLERAGETESDMLNFLKCCLRNPQIRSLLSEPELAELLGRCERISASQSGGSAWKKYRTLVAGTLKSAVPSYLKKPLRPVYRRVVGRGGGPPKNS